MARSTGYINVALVMDDASASTTQLWAGKGEDHAEALAFIGRKVQDQHGRADVLLAVVHDTRTGDTRHYTVRRCSAQVVELVTPAGRVQHTITVNR